MEGWKEGNNGSGQGRLKWCICVTAVIFGRQNASYCTKVWEISTSRRGNNYYTSTNLFLLQCHQSDVLRFDLPYDKLVIACGSKSATFNVPGFASQEEKISTQGPPDPSMPCPPSMPLGSETGTDHHNVFFLKQLMHARAIRNRILECFERASNPLTDPTER